MAKHCDKHTRFNPNCEECKLKRDEELQSNENTSPKLYQMVVLNNDQIPEIPSVFEMMESKGYVFYTQISSPIFKIMLLFKKK